MRIVPSGTHKLMVAQSLRDDNLGLDPSLDFGPLGADGQTLSNDNASPVNPDLDSASLEQATANQFTEDQSDGSTDIREFVFKTLEQWGYPPRRLRDFESEFLDETIYPNDQKELSIVIPDRYYGKNRRISDKDLHALTREIRDKFGLSFLEGKRKDKKITLNFSSQAAEPEEGEEANTDVLDEVYGSSESAKASKKPKRKQSYTMNELLKQNHQHLFDIINKD